MTYEGPERRIEVDEESKIKGIAARAIRGNIRLDQLPSRSTDEQDLIMRVREYIDSLLETDERILLTKLCDMGLSGRAANVIQRYIGRSVPIDKHTIIGDLVQLDSFTLMRSKYFGEVSLKDVQDCLNSYGLKLGMQLTDDQLKYMELHRPSRK